MYLASMKPVLAIEYVKYTKMSRLCKPPDGTDENTLNIAKRKKREFPTKMLYEELKCAQAKNISFTFITGKTGGKLLNFSACSFQALGKVDGSYLVQCASSYFSCQLHLF